MAFGAAPSQGAPSSSPMDDYMRTYGERLQSMLAGEAGGGALGGGAPVVASGFTDNGQIPPDQGLGPDLYRNLGVPSTAGGGGPSAPQGGAPPPPQGQQSAPGAAPGGDQGGGAGGKGVSFRDIWNAQDKSTRQQYLDKLQDNLKAANQSIDGAYKQMMDQLGGRPDPSLSKQEKGMLLMEFGMRMMQHSSGRYGYGQDTGAALGAAGVETLGSMRNLQLQKLSRQQRYDQMQQQLAIAQGREKTNLAARSALETGRDIRAFGQQDTMLAREGMRQEGAGERQESRNSAADRRSQLAQQGIVRTFVDDSGSEIGVTRSGRTVNLGKAAPGSSGMGGKGGKGFASEANYRMYMDTYGKDENGQPLEGPALEQVKKDALTYASNPHAFTLTDAQKRQMAERSADNYIRSNQLSFAGMNDEEIAAKRTQFAEETYQRLKRNGTAAPNAGANVPPRPGSGLASPGGAPAKPAGRPATTPPPGSPTPNQKQMHALKSDPARIAPFFVKKFGWLPPEYHKYLNQTGIQPQSALH